MTAHVRSAIALIVVGLGSGCSGVHGQPFDPGLIGRQAYLCCNIRFNAAFRAADSNYGVYLSDAGYTARGPMLHAGTPIRVVDVGSRAVAFRPLDSATTHFITFSYGRHLQTAAQYFQNISSPPIQWTNSRSSRTTSLPGSKTAASWKA